MLPGGVFNTRYDSDLAILRTKTHWLLLAIGLVVAFTVPLFADDYWLGLLIDLGIAVVAVLGLHILSGLCGLISIAQAAFVGVGAYTVAILATQVGLNSWLCLPICALSAGLVGLFFGLPCFRLKGFYLVISTLAAHFVIIWCFEHFEGVTGGFGGLHLDPLSLGPIDLRSRSAFYLLTVAVVVLATFLVKNIQRTAAGRAFVAIRDNELAAEVSGIPVFRYKMLAFFIGCLFAGVAGWLWAYYQRSVAPSHFQLIDSIWYIGMLIVGGWGTTTGVFFGAISLSFLDVLLKDYINPALVKSLPPDWAGQISVSTGLILFGGIIIAFMILEPRGLYYRWERLKSYYRLHPYSHIPVPVKEDEEKEGEMDDSLG
jgi:branched-chain amino acid transport system permease protein